MARSVCRNGVSYQDVPAALCHSLLGLPGTDRLTLREAVLLHIVLTASEDLMAVDVEGQIFVNLAQRHAFGKPRTDPARRERSEIRQVPRTDVACPCPAAGEGVLMARIVTSRYRYWRLVLCGAAGALLAGCATNARPSDEFLAVHGYWYHDANHPNGGGAQAGQQAIDNAISGTWLWPPIDTRPR
jgi:hypothetical protein